MFPDWAMGYVGSEPASLTAYEHLSADQRLLEGEDLLRSLVNTWEPSPTA